MAEGFLLKENGRSPQKKSTFEDSNKTRSVTKRSTASHTRPVADSRIIFRMVTYFMGMSKLHHRNIFIATWFVPPLFPFKEFPKTWLLTSDNW